MGINLIKPIHIAMEFKNITRTETLVEAGRLTERARQRTSAQKKLLADLDFSKQVLADDERTSANSSRSSSRARKPGNCARRLWKKQFRSGSISKSQKSTLMT